MDKYQKAQQKYNDAADAAWEQRLASIRLGAKMSDIEHTYQTALQVAGDELRQVLGPRPVQPSGVD